MLDDQRARGPDGAAVRSAGPLTLGFTRLAIVGGRGVDQPLEVDGMLVATIGEIYNHEALWRRFGGASSPPPGGSDCAVVPLLARAAGPGFVEHLDGIFSGAVYDVARSKLVLFRDHVGVKPMHWCKVEGGIGFASSTSALTRVIEPRLNRRRLRSYLATGYVEGASTLLAGVHDLPPGSTGVLDRSRTGISVRRWFDPARGAAASPPSLRALIEDAVKTETPGAGATHACLSGGVDSTIATTVAARKRPDLTALTVVYDDWECDGDRLHARRVASALGIRQTEVRVGWRDYLDGVRAPWPFDQPLADPNALAFARLCSCVSADGGRVLLSGDGADELFCGYPYYRRGRGARLLATAVAATFDSMTTPNDREFVRRLTGLPARRPLTVVRGSPLRHMQIRDIGGWLEANLLEKADRFGMAHSVEVRVPFLRRAVVAAALALSDEEKISAAGEGKYALRREFAALLPRHVLDRPKQGFPCPLDEWLVGPLGRELADEARDPAGGGWDADAEQALWYDHLSGRRNWGQQLWRLAVLRAWWRTVNVKGEDRCRAAGSLR